MPRLKKRSKKDWEEKNKEYWGNRYNQIEQAQNNKSAALVREINKKYDAAMREIDAKINAWYGRFASNNGITMADAIKVLNADQLAEFRWTLQQYIDAAKVGPKMAREVENASIRFHISRIEALKLDIKGQVALATGQTASKTDEMLRNVYVDTYNKSMYTMQNGIGVAFDIAGIDKATLQAVIRRPWAADGKTFSSRLWTDQAKLISVVDKEMSSMAMGLSGPGNAIKNVAKAMDTSRKQAAKIIMTEQSYFTEQSCKASYEETGVDEYEVNAELDGKTCSRCQSKDDGSPKPVSEMNPGENAPPFHPFCRCITVPYFDDDFGTRWVRGADGKGHTIPNMSYKKWKELYGGGDKH